MSKTETVRRNTNNVRSNRKWIDERTVQDNTEADKYGHKVTHTSKRVVMHFTPLTPAQRLTKAGDPWGSNTSLAVHGILGLILGVLTLVNLFGAGPLFAIVAFLNLIRLAMLAYGWSGKQFIKRVKAGDTMVLWAKGGTKPSAVVDRVDRYIEKLAQLKEAADRANENSTLPAAYEVCKDEARRYLLQIQAVLDSVIDSRVATRTSTNTILDKMVTELVERIDKIEELLTTEAHRKVEIAIRPENHHTLDAQISVIQASTTASLALGSGSDDSDDAKFDVDKQMEILRKRNYGAASTPATA